MGYYIQQHHFQQMWRHNVHVMTRKFLHPLFCISTSYLSHSDCQVVILKSHCSDVFAHHQKLCKPEHIFKQTLVNFFYCENMRSVLILRHSYANDYVAKFESGQIQDLVNQSFERGQIQGWVNQSHSSIGQKLSRANSKLYTLYLSFQAKQSYRSHSFPSGNRDQRRLIHEFVECYGCSKLNTLYLSFQAKQSYRSHSFPSVNRDQRRLIHELAECYGYSKLYTLYLSFQAKQS